MIRSSLAKSLIAGAFALATIGSVSAAPYSAVYVFGDSLSDTGNVQAATGLAQPQIGSNTPLPAGQVGYANGRWVDNQGAGVWVDTFAPALGGASQASLTGGTNYAWAGARTGTNANPAGAWYLNQQVGSYLTNSGGTASSSALYAILIGGNDIAAIIEAAAAPGNPNPAATIGAGVTAGLGSIQSQVTTLYAAGARNFLLFNAPDVLPSPRFQQVLGSLDAAGQAGLTFVANSTVTAWNTNFANMVSGLRAGLTGEDIDTFDLAGFGAALGANLAGNGYDGSSAACYIAGTPPTICSTPATRFFWDPFHLNSRVHSQLAAAAIAAVPLPGVLGLMALGFGVMLIARRKAA